MLRIQSCLLLAALVGSSGLQAAETFSDAQVADIHNGINQVTLAGRPLMLVSAWRDNGNAHGFNVVTMYADLPAWNDMPRWQIIPVFIKGDTPNGSHEALDLTSSGGADCTVQNFRLFSPKGSNKLWLVIATRDFGDSFYDTKPVTFDFYRLETEAAVNPGSPRIDFAFDHRVRSAKSYCDVEIALKQELGLPVVEGARLHGHPDGHSL